MAQHEDLDILGTIASTAQYQEFEYEADKTVETGHAPILAASEPRRSRPRETPAQHARAGIRHPNAERAWLVMNRQTPYVVCDTDGTPVTAEHAAAIIAERWTVPPDDRARRRSKKGKAPQAITTRRHERGATFPNPHRQPDTTHPSTRATEPNNRPLDNPIRHRESDCPVRMGWC
jgi:hypothetical protein